MGLETRRVSSPWYVFFSWFFFFPSILMIYTGTIYVTQATATISGPNDAYHVVWALGECFFKIIHWFYILTIIVYRFSNVQTMGPKRQCTVVWAPVLCINRSPRHHHHHVITTTSSPLHATTTTPKTPHRGRTTVKPSFGPSKYFFYIYIYKHRYIYRCRYIYTDIFIDIDIYRYIILIEM